MKIVEFIKAHWKSVTLVGGFIFATIGNLNNIKSLWVDFIEPLIRAPIPTLSRSPEGDLHPNDKLTLTYTAPNKGYLSLWNIDAAHDSAKKLLPLKGLGALPLSADIQTGHLTLTINSDSKGTDKYLLIWTPEHEPEQLPSNEYRSETAFNAAVDTLKKHNQAVISPVLSIPIYP